MKITKINQRTIDKLFNSTKQCVECNYMMAIGVASLVIKFIALTMNFGHQRGIFAD